MSQTAQLLLRAAGMSCALGWHLDAAACAMRANMDHFTESDFECEQGQPVRVAKLPIEEWGDARLQQLLQAALQDCLQHLTPVQKQSLFDPAKSACVVLLPAQGRYYSDVRTCWELAHDALEIQGMAYGAQTELSTALKGSGRAGLVDGLRQAQKLLAQGFRQILLLAVESGLNAPDIQADLAAQRLLTAENSDGHLPGEAAVALLLTADDGYSPGLRLRGMGQGQESGRPDGSTPSRAQGLSTALRAACAQAGIAPEMLEFRLSDQNGEKFYSREAGNAFTRLMFGAPHSLKLLTLADKIGEIGCVCGPAMLAWMWHEMARADCTPGSCGVLHLANEEGLRSAVVFDYQGSLSHGNPRLRKSA